MRSRARVLAAAVLIAACSRAAAQGVSVEALATAEVFKTDGGSRLLAINGGTPVLRGQAYGWLAYQPTSSLRIMALGELYGVTGSDHEIEGELQALSLRWWRSRTLRIEAGKILLPIGEFAPRRFANVNPLVGAPDTYADMYPWGASVTGGFGPIDYTAAAVTLPAVNERYTPAPGSRVRPVVGVGVSAGPRFRLGLGATHGPYLGESVTAQLPSGTSWSHYSQTVATADLRYSVGRLDARGEMAWSSYQVPTVARPVRGLGWYLESRLTISPRVFAAARYEYNRYPFVMAVSPDFWVGTVTTQMNAEVAAGYRLSPDALVKTALRKDHWPVHEIPGMSFPDGYALAVQLTVHADLVQLLQRKP